MALFESKIETWGDWSGIFGDKQAFAPLIEEIYGRHGLPFAKPENVSPGTNAVFAVGDTVAKLFVPENIWEETDADYRAELSGMEHALSKGADVPELLAAGTYDDGGTLWRYLIMKRAEGREYSGDLPEQMRRTVGKRLRELLLRLNTPSDEPNRTLEQARANEEWSEFSPEFQRERLAYLDSYPAYVPVWLHNDVNPDNLLVTEDGGITLIDFADARTGPIESEYAIVCAELFRFDRAGLDGFFTEGYSAEKIADICVRGLLVHPFGTNVLHDRKLDWIKSIDELSREIIVRVLSN